MTSVLMVSRARRFASARSCGSVRGVVDHGWCQSIYFRDPNGLQLEFCCLTADLDESHRAGRHDEVWRKLSRR